MNIRHLIVCCIVLLLVACGSSNRANNQSDVSNNHSSGSDNTSGSTTTGGNNASQSVGGNEPSQIIIGKWETISAPRVSGVGEMMEFFQDGTISVDGKSARWSFPDNSKLKLETPMGGRIFDFSLNTDQITLKDTGGTLILKRYKELPIETQSLVGIWHPSSGAGIDKCLDLSSYNAGSDQKEIHLNSDNTARVKNTTKDTEEPFIDLNGKWSVQNNQVNISVSGKRISGNASAESTCKIQSVSASQLVLQDSDGKELRYIRTIDTTK